MNDLLPFFGLMAALFFVAASLSNQIDDAKDEILKEIRNQKDKDE